MLPIGRYEVTATLSYGVPSCGDGRRLEVTAAFEAIDGRPCPVDLEAEAEASHSLDPEGPESDCVLPTEIVAGPTKRAVPLPSADRVTPELVLHRYLVALVAGDCAEAHRFVADTFVIGSGELCGIADIGSTEIRGRPARGDASEHTFATTIVIDATEDPSLELGPMTWFYTLREATDGTWTIVGGGSGP